MSSEAAFRSRIERHLIGVLHRGPIGFWDLVRHCSGAYPIDVRSALNTLVERGTVVFREHAYTLKSQPATSGAEQIPESLVPLSAGGSLASLSRINVLPPPHPLDYDWRFTSDTQKFLAKEILRLAGEKTTICVFGAPSLFLRLQEIGSNPVLVDRNARLAECLGCAPQVICADLFLPLPIDLRFGIVIADPPWYLEYYEAFILRASEALQHEGYLLLSMLPSLTRPSAVLDRAHVLDYCRRAGFDLVECAASNLEYESPPFECAALFAEALSCEQWRSGDLFIFKKIADIENNLPRTFKSTEDRWHTFEMRGLIVKIRDRDEAEKKLGMFCYSLASKDAYFTSVSRRAPERENIDLWTSDNRVYALSRPSIMRYALEHFDLGLDNAISLTSKAYHLSKPEEESVSKLLKELTENRFSAPLR